MSPDIGTATPSRAVTFRALQSLTLRAQGTRTYHIVKERSALSLILQVFISTLYGVVLTLEGNQNQRRYVLRIAWLYPSANYSRLSTTFRTLLLIYLVV